MGCIERCQDAIELCRISSPVQQDTWIFDRFFSRQLNRFKCTVVPYIVRSFDINMHNWLIRTESVGSSFSRNDGPLMYPSAEEIVSRDQTYLSQSSKLDLWLHRMVPK